jgi:hypothetical protein
MDPIFNFATGLPNKAVVEEVAATLIEHRKFKRVKIAVHVQPSEGGEEADKALSARYAKVIRDAIQSWLSNTDNLIVEGDQQKTTLQWLPPEGSKHPLVPPEQRGAAKLNNRVELVIMEEDESRGRISI